MVVAYAEPRCLASNLTYRVALFFGLITAGNWFLSLLLEPLFFPAHVIQWHTSVELLCIAVALFAFLISWLTYHEQNAFSNILGFGFLLVALFDFMHVASFPARNYFNTDHDLATWFWLLGRTAEALVLLAIAVGFRGTLPKMSILITLLATFTALSWILLVFPDLPEMYVQGQGVTPLKILWEYAICGVYAAVLILYLRGLEAREPQCALAIVMAVLSTIAAEICFTFYTSIGFWNLVGHNFKLVAYVYILRGMICTSVLAPYSRLKAQDIALRKEIAERESAQKELLSTKERLQYILQSSPGVIYTVSAGRDYAVTYVSENTNVLFGYDHRDFIGTPDFFLDRVHPEDRGKVMTEFQALRNHSERSMQFRFLLENGEYRWAQTHARLIHDPHSGEPKEIVGCLTDITDYKEMENEVQKSHQEIASVLESIEEGFLALDKDWYINYVNKEMERWSGRKRDELLGQNVWHVFPTLLGTTFHRECVKAAESSQAVVFDHTGANSQTFEIRLYPRDDGLLLFFRDVAEERKLRLDMLRLDRLNLVGEMAAGIAHEVRNPMTSARGFIQLLSEKHGCEPYGSYFGLITEEIDRANAIITEFLSLARNRTADRQMANLNTVIIALLPLIQADGATRDRYVEVQLGEIPDLFMDEKEIRQLILNLTRNGLEAMAPGGVLTIKTKQDGDQLVLAVADQGKGISPEVMEKLGTPFFTTKENGTGLGLAMCYSIAARHNAIISVDSYEGSTTFEVRFGLTDQSSLASPLQEGKTA